MFAIFVVIVEMILSHRSRRVSNLRKKSPDGHCLTGAFLYWNQWAGLFGHKGIESLGFRGHLTLDFPFSFIVVFQSRQNFSRRKSRKNAHFHSQICTFASSKSERSLAIQNNVPQSTPLISKSLPIHLS